MTCRGLPFFRQLTSSTCRWYCASHATGYTASRTREKLALYYLLSRFDLVAKQGRFGREMCFGRFGTASPSYRLSKLHRTISSSAHRRKQGEDIGDEESFDFKKMQWRKTIESIVANDEKENYDSSNISSSSPFDVNDMGNVANSMESENDDMEARLLRLHRSTGEGVDPEPSESGWTIDNSYRSGTSYGQDRVYHGEELSEESEVEAEGEYDDEDDSTYDSDSDLNEGSDEEYEFEETDDELEELLANTSFIQMPPKDDADNGEELDYHLRPDHIFMESEYDPEVFDVSQPVEKHPNMSGKPTISVKDAIQFADFRNVRFLTNFIGESGNILARREFNMQAKSHGKIIKAIKTARAFGLMPYTNMGRPPFRFNERIDEDEGLVSSDESADDSSERDHIEQNT